MKVLKINSSANGNHSISRNLVDYISTKLLEKYSQVEIDERDVAKDNLPHLDENFVRAMFQKGSLNEVDQKALKLSDELIAELKASDVLLFGVPMYNFTVPASLKAYFDLIARPGETFNFSSGYSQGLLEDKKAIVVITSGGTKIGSDQDFTKEYIRTFLKFIGITQVEFIEMDQAGFKYQEKIQIAAKQIAAII